VLIVEDIRGLGASKTEATAADEAEKPSNS